MSHPSVSRSRIVLASGNAGKLAELRALLAGSGVEAVPQSDYAVDAAEETGATFVENALIKARHAARISGLPAIADDSGLCVDVLGGAPGLHSARYAGAHGDDDANNRRLLSELEGLVEGRRKARFHCVLVLLRHADDPRPLIAEGEWHGRIIDAPRGAGGFGYDPLFLDPEQGMTAAEMPAELKNRISHRGQALRALKSKLAGWP
ncbi:MAG: RdgB/HAM1 family non-canonical purine NTP pyrophosphatase [Xanthomonadaceae bacterium]|jgi:XTP/dITP diphosphohydrolase|nr:RdgB/HAM1 family non-canonical purine NTP pyrophosphatase [Xanthomonadaceae bacterium]